VKDAGGPIVPDLTCLLVLLALYCAIHGFVAALKRLVGRP
jgi:hypothetical protein